MSILRFSGNSSGTGTVTLESPNVNSNLTITLPSTSAQLVTSSDVRSNFTGGTGVSVDSGTGVISIGQAVATNSSVTFNNITVSGNLTVSGTTTTVNTETINLADNIITLNSNATGSPSENSGIEVERGDSTNVSLIWNESTDRWQFTNDGSTYVNLVTSTADLTENTNLYFTNARARTAISAAGTAISYDNSTGVITGSGATTGKAIAMAMVFGF